MTEQLEGQLSIFDLDTWSGRTYQEACQVLENETEKTTKEKTSKPSSRKSSKSSAKMPLTCLCLTRGSGKKPDTSQEWVTMESPFPWLIGYTMPSFGMFHKDGKEYVSWLTSTDSQPDKYYLTLNLNEFPREERNITLSDILQEDADPRYELSARACQGILNRASKKGKQLPEILKKALENQISRGDSSYS